MYIDTHCHLNFKAFANDYAAVIERALGAGVKKMIVAGSNLETSAQAVQIASEYQNVYAAVGLHPIHAGDEDFGDEFEKLAKNKKVVAIGETGIDYYHGRENAELQKEVFQKHLNLARVLSKPVILHCREAADDLLSILMAQSSVPKAVLHCFSEDCQFAKIILDMGFYLSFTGLITFTKNQETFEVIKNVPLERILIETDCPYMTPELYRGKRNEPAYVIEIAQKIAELRKIPIEDVERATTQNAMEFFKLS